MKLVLTGARFSSRKTFLRLVFLLAAPSSVRLFAAVSFECVNRRTMFEQYDCAKSGGTRRGAAGSQKSHFPVKCAVGVSLTKVNPFRVRRVTRSSPYCCSTAGAALRPLEPNGVFAEKGKNGLRKWTFDKRKISQFTK